jgi:hypothetical protein
MIRGLWELQDQLPELDLEPFLHRYFVTGLKKGAILIRGLWELQDKLPSSFHTGNLHKRRQFLKGGLWYRYRISVQA